MSGYTPTETYVRACLIAQLDWEREHDGQPRTPERGREVVSEADRLIARIKAEALREAAISMRAHKNPGHWNLRDESEPRDRSASPDAWLEIRADRIERHQEPKETSDE